MPSKKRGVFKPSASTSKPLSPARQQAKINKLVSIWRYLLWTHASSKDRDDAMDIVTWDMDEFTDKQHDRADAYSKHWSNYNPNDRRVIPYVPSV